MIKNSKVSLIIWVVFIAAIMLFPPSVNAAGPEPSFIPVYGKSFKRRKNPAQLTTLSETKLKEKEYIKIGRVWGSRLIKTCYQGDCTSAEGGTPPTDQILELAARKGGDLVKLLSDNKSSSYESQVEECLRYEKVSVPVVDMATGLKTGRGGGTAKQCVQYNRYMVTKHSEMSEGWVWRLEPGFKVSRNSVSSDLGLALVKKDQRWKFIDQKGAVVLEMKDSTGSFHEGLAAFQKWEDGEKWGFMDRTGRPVIQARFDAVSRFSEGLAAVKKGDAYGYIDRSGRMVIPPRFQVAGSFSEGLAVVSTEKVSGYYAREKVYGYINRSGDFAIEPGFYRAGSFSEGLAPVAYAKNKKGYGVHGYIDPSGELKIKGLTSAHEFSDGLAAASRKLGRKGYIDHSGNFVLKPKWNNVQPFSEGLAAVKKKTGVPWGYINKKGKYVIKPRFYFAGNFYGGVAWVKADCGRKPEYCFNGYINREGKFLLEPQFQTTRPFSRAADLQIPED